MPISKARIAALRFIWPTTVGHRLLMFKLGGLAGPRIGPLAAWYRRWLIPRTCIIAVVGSLGKTTTRRMAAAALGGRVPCVLENSGSWVALALFLVRRWHKEA